MEIEHQVSENNHHQPITSLSNNTTTTEITSKTKSVPLLILNIFLLTVGASGSPLMLRLYFIHGGKRIWFSAFLQTAAFPILLLSFLLRHRRRRHNSRSSFFSLSPFLLLSSTVLGLLTGADNFLYSYGVSFLPVSTSSLLISTQLGFIAVFAYFIVKQKFTAACVNAVVLLTFGAVVLGVDSNGDRPEGESKGKYNVGFVMTLGAAALYGLVLPLVEWTYAKAKQEVNYSVVMEMQLVIGFFATVFCGVGMAVNNDFQAIPREAKVYELGEAKYYMIVVFTTIVTQCFFLGVVGTINYSSALLSGIIISASIIITEVFGVIFFHEKFDGEKGVALALSLWGSASYFYGEYKQHQKSIKSVRKINLPVSV